MTGSAKMPKKIQNDADWKESERFDDVLRAFYGSQPSSSSSLLTSDGAILIADRTKILERWTEHFNAVPYLPSSITDEAIQRLLQVLVNQEMDMPPTLQETVKAISQLSSRNTRGIDAIPAEVYKSRGPVLTQKLTDIFQSMWALGVIPHDL